MASLSRLEDLLQMCLTIIVHFEIKKTRNLVSVDKDAGYSIAENIVKVKYWGSQSIGPTFEDILFCALKNDVFQALRLRSLVSQFI